jgi:hypothetical protein
MLCFRVIDAQHPRLLFSLPHAAAVHPGTQFASSAKSFPLTLFADPDLLTPFVSHLYKNIGGEGCLRFFGPTISTIPFPFTPLPTLLHFLALTQNSTLLFSIVSALFGENTRVVGVPTKSRIERKKRWRGELAATKTRKEAG